MNHEETLRLLGPYHDGELDLSTCVTLEEHLATCADCRAELERVRELVAVIESKAMRFKPSPFLKTRIAASLREKEVRSPGPAWWTNVSRGWLYSGLGASAVLLIFFAGSVSWTGQIPEMERDAMNNHVRSLQVNHLVDVASSDQHTVKPWFAGKLDYSPQVIDLGPAGYPVIGGRLDVLAHRPVAAIVYQRRKHYLNLFIWPAEENPGSEKLYQRNGYHLLAWTKGGMHYLAVSELGEKELREFAGLIQEQTLDNKPGE